MAYSLFDSIKILHQQLEHENLDIHRTQEELAIIVRYGRESSKLRIITQFLNMLEVLARVYEYDDASHIAQVKHLMKQILALILSMSSGGMANTEGMKLLQQLSSEVKKYLVSKLGSDPFLYDPKLIEQLSSDVDQDILQIRTLFSRTILPQHIKSTYETVLYYLNRLHDHIDFVQISEFDQLIQALKTFVIHEYKENRFVSIIQNADFQLALEYFERRATFIRHNIHSVKILADHLIETTPKALIERLLYPSKDVALVPTPRDTKDLHLVLSDDEITALMDDQTEFDIVSFDNQNINLVENEKKLSLDQVTPTSPKEIKTKNSTINLEEYLLVKNKNKKSELNPSLLQNSSFEDQEDFLVRSIGKIYQKQEQLISWLDKDVYMEKEDDIKEISELIEALRNNIFATYYVSIEDCLGQDLRSFIHQEIQNQDKRIRLGIRGEKSEILRRNKEFIREIVFQLVKNSLNFSIETTARRKALDKNQMAWLFIEFDDTGDFFHIYVRDDGRGVLLENMNLQEMNQKINNVGGSVQVDYMENEYLKIHVQIPMKKIMKDTLLVQMGEYNILIPNRCIHKILDPKEASQLLREERCFGQVNLASVLELGNIPVKMFILCEFGADKILFGVDTVQYRWDAFAEEWENTKFMPCVHEISILKDGSIGFLVSEKEIFQKAKRLIIKRSEIMMSNKMKEI